MTTDPIESLERRIAELERRNRHLDTAVRRAAELLSGVIGVDAAEGRRVTDARERLVLALAREELVR